MFLHLDKKYRIAAVVTAVIAIMAFFLMRHTVKHAVQVDRQIDSLARLRDVYQTHITQDSTLIENLQYDDYLEQYAREHFRMQRADEDVYMIGDSCR